MWKFTIVIYKCFVLFAPTFPLRNQDTQHPYHFHVARQFRASRWTGVVDRSQGSYPKNGLFHVLPDFPDRLCVNRNGVWKQRLFRNKRFRKNTRRFSSRERRNDLYHCQSYFYIFISLWHENVYPVSCVLWHTTESVTFFIITGVALRKLSYNIFYLILPYLTLSLILSCKQRVYLWCHGNVLAVANKFSE